MNIHPRYSLATLLALGLLLVLTPGCDSLLDLDPQNNIEQDRALETPGNVEAALVGAYNMLSDYDLYGGQFKMLSDLLGDASEINWTGTFEEPRQVWVKTIRIDNLFIEDQWIDAYDAINIANNVLSALDLFEDEGRRERVEGEARFIRGTLYFELVRHFAKTWDDGDPSSNPGLPLVLEPTRGIDEQNNVPRASVAAVYDQVIEDLTQAEQQLPESNGFFATTWAASAMLSRVYLMQDRYEEAAQAASRVIESGQFELAPTFAQAFNNTEDIPEYVFSIQVSPQDGDHSLNLFYAAEVYNGRGDINVLPAHLDLYEEGDERGAFFYNDPSNDRVRTTKWQAGEAEGANIPVIRLAEMYLTRAEANLRAGTEIGAPPLEDINTVRERADLDPLDSVTIEDVLRERKLELAFEGDLLHTLKRTEQNVGTMSFSAPELVYPIPQREVDANPEIEQNPGYAS